MGKLSVSPTERHSYSRFDLVKEQGFPASFMNINQRYYAADVQRFLPTPAPWIQVSRWARERTKKDVSIRLGAIAQNDFVLVELTHFHSFWEHQFYTSATRPGPFKMPGGQITQVPLMYQTRHFDYFEGSKFQAVVLPYSDGTSMYVFLPSEDSSLAELEQSLTAENWQTWSPKFESRLGRVGLPRFQIENGFDVRAALEEDRSKTGL